MKTLVIAEHNNAQSNECNLATINAAQKFAQPIDVCIFGDNCQEAVKQLCSIEEIDNVLYFNHKDLRYCVAENIVGLLVPIANNYNVILASSTTFGKNCLPRLAAKLDTEQLSDVIAIEDVNTFKRPIYAGNAIATIKVTSDKKIATIRASAFIKVQYGNNSISPTNIPVKLPKSIAKVIKLQQEKSKRPELTSAKIVVSGGRGLESKEKFKLIEQFADVLNAGVGASRAAVDAGFVPNDYQVGQTGKIVSPELYIAVGLSGAIQHLAGMQDSKIIVAINKDPNAPIFQVANYGIVGDLFCIVPEFIKLITK